MSVSELSTSAQNYLKVVWAGAEWSDEPITASVIADRLGLRLSTISEGIRRLADQGLLHHTPYGAVELTETGRMHALSMVRRHRLIETFLVQTLGYRWDEVHDEAEHLEHAVSDLMVDRIDTLLEFPTRDPHGDPIPSADGTLLMPQAIQLSLVTPGSENSVERTVERIADDEPALLQFFEERNVVVGTVITITEGAPYSGTLSVTPAGATAPITLGKQAIEALYVSATELSQEKIHP